MNIRVLELIQRPENITVEDISILQSEISKFPYMQSVRTLYLSAIHQFDAENYHKELTKTAAYTTDKKILYQFINSKKEAEKKESVRLKKINLVKEPEVELQNSAVSEPVLKNIIPEKDTNIIVNSTELESPISNKEENNKVVDSSIKTTEDLEIPAPEIDKLYDNQDVVGAVSLISDTELENPILDNKENEFEVFNEEENLEFENKIFAELAAEEEKENNVFKTREKDLNFSKDTVLENIDAINETDIKLSEISFNGFESFLPDVKFTVPILKQEPIPQNQDIADEIIQPIDVNTNEAQKSEVNKPQSLSYEDEIVKLVENQEEIESDAGAGIAIEEEISEPEIHFEWKPMSFVQNPLDAQIQISKPENSNTSEIKNTVVPIARPVEMEPIEEISGEEIVPETHTEIVKEVPLPENNISETTDKEPMINNVEEEIVAETTAAAEVSSNIPNFVNTWQNWLKIERTEVSKAEKAEPVKIIEKKAEIIDKFIEESPKISQLKEEVSYVVKEKTGDISHLMTETLAKLYIEQRLYAKAITAYEALQKKHPEKQKEFELKIQEIQELKYNR